jgi:hypothetical protein
VEDTDPGPGAGMGELLEGDDMPARATVWAIPPKREVLIPAGWADPRWPSEFLE